MFEPSQFERLFDDISVYLRRFLLVAFLFLMLGATLNLWEAFSAFISTAEIGEGFWSLVGVGSGFAFVSGLFFVMAKHLFSKSSSSNLSNRFRYVWGSACVATALVSWLLWLECYLALVGAFPEAPWLAWHDNLDGIEVAAVIWMMVIGYAAPAVVAAELMGRLYLYFFSLNWLAHPSLEHNNPQKTERQIRGDSHV